MHTYDCDPILTDSEVLDFCKKGFIVLDGVMPKEINERVVEECNKAVAANHGIKEAFSTGSQNHQPPQPNSL